ncbi:hypothetical protein MMC15_003934 [Xylographa vitiligo]|nr:hypothetical protein [Xylographa vitiligo]
MDFVLSFAHFCELHGPTSILCTQALPAACSTCLSLSPASSPRPSAKPTAADHFSSTKDRRPLSAGVGGFGVGDGDKCASCSISLPDQAFECQSDKVARGVKDRTPLRTREEIHACTNQYAQRDEDDRPPPSLLPHDSFDSSGSGSSCHTHNLEYVSSSSPAESESYSSLRRATIRTLSGEQLPRGQTSGPLWFGDPVAGYTIAYVFRLADSHARGRQRYYALLALAGSETQRAFEACTVLWSFFEQIAMNIVEAAEDVAARSIIDDSPPERGYVTPISSFLTGRTMDPDGYPRRGAANVRANGIAELVDNDRFFCELHMMFVGILQDLGRVLGGMKVKAEDPEHEAVEAYAEPPKVLQSDHGDQDDEKSSPTTSRPELRMSGNSPSRFSRSPAPACIPALVGSHRQQVAV